MRLLAVLIALLLAHPVHAGAWMRDEGTGFLSFSGTIDEDGHSTGAIYGEFGLNPKLTLGFKIDTSMPLGQLAGGNAEVFVRKPLSTDKRDFKLAYEIGLGVTQDIETHALVRVGLSYGKGITLRNRSGWVTLDGAVEWTAQDSQTKFKVDSTVGLALDDRFKVMMQVFYSATDEEQSTTLAPSVIWTPKAGGRNSYQLGFEAEDGSMAVKIGLWRSF